MNIHNIRFGTNVCLLETLFIMMFRTKCLNVMINNRRKLAILLNLFAMFTLGATQLILSLLESTYRNSAENVTCVLNTK